MKGPGRPYFVSPGHDWKEIHKAVISCDKYHGAIATTMMVDSGTSSTSYSCLLPGLGAPL